MSHLSEDFLTEFWRQLHDFLRDNKWPAVKSLGCLCLNLCTSKEQRCNLLVARARAEAHLQEFAAAHEDLSAADALGFRMDEVALYRESKEILSKSGEEYVPFVYDAFQDGRWWGSIASTAAKWKTSLTGDTVDVWLSKEVSQEAASQALKQALLEFAAEASLQPAPHAETKRQEGRSKPTHVVVTAMGRRLFCKRALTAGRAEHEVRMYGEAIDQGLVGRACLALYGTVNIAGDVWILLEHADRLFSKRDWRERAKVAAAIRALRLFHLCGLTHGDVTAHHFAWTQEDGRVTAFLLDLDLSLYSGHRYIQPPRPQSLPEDRYTAEKNRVHNGSVRLTLRYGSTMQHLGFAATPSCDLMAMLFVCGHYCLPTSLPWAQREKKIVGQDLAQAANVTLLEKLLVVAGRRYTVETVLKSKNAQLEVALNSDDEDLSGFAGPIESGPIESDSEDDESSTAPSCTSSSSLSRAAIDTSFPELPPMPPSHETLPSSPLHHGESHPSASTPAETELSTEVSVPSQIYMEHELLRAALDAAYEAQVNTHTVEEAEYNARQCIALQHFAAATTSDDPIALSRFPDSPVSPLGAKSADHLYAGKTVTLCPRSAAKKKNDVAGLDAGTPLSAQNPGVQLDDELPTPCKTLDMSSTEAGSQTPGPADSAALPEASGEDSSSRRKASKAIKQLIVEHSHAAEVAAKEGAGIQLKPGSFLPRGQLPLLEVMGKVKCTHKSAGDSSVIWERPFAADLVRTPELAVTRTTEVDFFGELSPAFLAKLPEAGKYVDIPSESCGGSVRVHCVPLRRKPNSYQVKMVRDGQGAGIAQHPLLIEMGNMDNARMVESKASQANVKVPSAQAAALGNKAPDCCWHPMFALKEGNELVVMVATTVQPGAVEGGRMVELAKELAMQAAAAEVPAKPAAGTDERWRHGRGLGDIERALQTYRPYQWPWLSALEALHGGVFWAQLNSPGLQQSLTCQAALTTMVEAVREVAQWRQGVNSSLMTTVDWLAARIMEMLDAMGIPEDYRQQYHLDMRGIVESLRATCSSTTSTSSSEASLQLATPTGSNRGYAAGSLSEASWPVSSSPAICRNLPPSVLRVLEEQFGASVDGILKAINNAELWTRYLFAESDLENLIELLVTSIEGSTRASVLARAKLLHKNLHQLAAEPEHWVAHAR